MAISVAETTQWTTRALPLALHVPNLLSLDAPLVAVSWHGLVSTVFCGEVDTGPTVVLFLTVWLIYMGDRLLDCRRLDFRREVPRRHRFVHRWSKVLWPVWLAVLVCCGILTLATLDTLLLSYGLVLFAGVVVYAWTVHGGSLLRNRLPKELIVALVFAVGVCLPTSQTQNTVPMLVTATLLGGLFVVNCLCVAKTQRISDRQQRIGSAVLMYPRLAAHLPAFAAVVMSAAIFSGCARLVPLLIAIAVTVSGLGLLLVTWLMDRDQGWISATKCDCLADYALLSPLLVLAIC